MQKNIKRLSQDFFRHAESKSVHGYHTKKFRVILKLGWYGPKLNDRRFQLVTIFNFNLIYSYAPWFQIQKYWYETEVCPI